MEYCSLLLAVLAEKYFFCFLLAEKKSTAFANTNYRTKTIKTVLLPQKCKKYFFFLTLMFYLLVWPRPQPSRVIIRSFYQWLFCLLNTSNCNECNDYSPNFWNDFWISPIWRWFLPFPVLKSQLDDQQNQLYSSGRRLHDLFIKYIHNIPCANVQTANPLSKTRTIGKIDRWTNK